MVYLAADANVCYQWVEGFHQSFGEIEGRRFFIPAASDSGMNLSDVFAEIGYIMSNVVKICLGVLTDELASIQSHGHSVMTYLVRDNCQQRTVKLLYQPIMM